MRNFGLIFLTLGLLPLTGQTQEKFIRLMDFKGSVQQNKVVLRWVIEAASIRGKFVVERSTEGGNWETCHEKTFVGYPNVDLEYTFAEKFLPEALFYRLTVSDGAEKTVLGTLHLEVPTVNLYFQPNWDQKHKKLHAAYILDQDKELMFRLYNRYGEQILTKLIPSGKAGSYQLTWDLKNLAKGSYLLVVTQVDLDVTIKEVRMEL